MTVELKTAILIWKRGDPIDTFLHSKLEAQGVNVPKLERRYRA